ncbi:helix-turn-helix transcriptional regulator [Mesorhizobium sp. LHD-90]|uniref:helix-turn-helix domain-containing protein n=1 Tax=Mesorhizobium sp. LHD-90 TaxID=3071414 RepID=UPI0027DF5F59|nr:helix-turn-helix transcriptional regulator [Mesorhizobium sp. LHD-90]MDQ6436915.1 helix-turn-helix transcriptional regulator [Mesorhizobium sp. LHD-90]
MSTALASPGPIIREWRARRRMSQLDLAMEAEISQRHLSFVESGRAKPSREMVLHLAERLELPLRETNRLLLAAGYAPGFVERKLDDPSMAPALEAVERVLAGHDPNPAVAVDRHWNLVRANAALAPFLADVADPALLAPPVNVLRLSLHPQGVAPRIVNFIEWRDHIVERLRRLNQAVADPVIVELERELRGYAVPKRTGPPSTTAYSPIAVPLRLRLDDTVLSFISTITVFGTPLDVTLSELAIESFFPADRATAEAMRELAARREAAPPP